MRIIIRILSRSRGVASIQLKCFITSRPEVPIRLGFKAAKALHTGLILHELPKPDIAKDIEIYLRFRLDQIRQDYNTDAPVDCALYSDWPTTKDFSQLVDMAVPLFIFASTVCLYIADALCGDPEEQLVKALKFGYSTSQLHALYLPVLNQLLLKRTHSGVEKHDEKEQADSLATFHKIVGSIVVLFDPLSRGALARLIGGISPRTIDNFLTGLQLVLHVLRDRSSGGVASSIFS